MSLIIVRARHNQSMETHVNASDTENNYNYTAFSNKNNSMSHKLSEETGTETNDETNDDLLDDSDDAEESDEIGSEESDETNNATGCDTDDMKETADLMHDEEINRVFANSNIGSGGEASKFLMSSRHSCINPTVKNLKNKKRMMNGDSLLDEMSSQESTSDSTTAESSDSVRISESSQTSMSPMVSDEEDEEDIETLKSNCMEKLLKSEQLAMVQQEQKESVIGKETKSREIDELEKKFKQIVDYDESESLACEDDDNEEEDEDDLEDTIEEDLVTG